jgi:hypothetical protein
MHINPYMVKPLRERLLQPVIVAITNKTNNTGTARTINPSLTPESQTGYAYTWSATGLPDGVSIRASDGRISGTIDSNARAQTYSVVVTASVTDGTETKTGTTSFNWTLTIPIVGPTNTRLLRAADRPGQPVGSGYCGWPNQILSGLSWEFTICKSGDGTNCGFNQFDKGTPASITGNIPSYWGYRTNTGWQSSAKYLEIGKTCSIIESNAFLAFYDVLRFRDQPNFPGLQIPRSVKEIGFAAFSGLPNLCADHGDVLTIPGTVKKIGKEAFSECTNIKAIILKEGITTIDTKAFSGINSLDNDILPVLRIPSTVRQLGPNFGVGAFLYSRDMDFVIGGNLTATSNLFDRGSARPMKNLYINSSLSQLSGQGKFSNYFSSSSNLYISPQYFNQWNNYKSHPGTTGSVSFSAFANWFSTPIQVFPRLWDTFPDAMDESWTADQFE